MRKTMWELKQAATPGLFHHLVKPFLQTAFTDM